MIITEIDDTWQQIQSVLSVQMTKATYQDHIAKTRLVSLSEDEAVIVAQNELTADWLEKRLKPILNRAIKSVVGTEYKIVIRIGDDGSSIIPEVNETGPLPTAKVESNVSGFTPVLDLLVERYDRETALIFGIVWRYCQMKDGVCSASRKKLASRIGASVKTVDRRLELLCSDGYIEDLTPGVRNRPHIYRDTGKIRLLVSVAVEETY